jgi:hypothetical protein
VTAASKCGASSSAVISYVQASGVNGRLVNEVVYTAKGSERGVLSANGMYDANHKFFTFMVHSDVFPSM